MRVGGFLSLAIAAICIAMPSAASAKLNTSTPEALTALMRAAGYCVGQDYALELIEGADPSLTTEVMTYRLRFDATYPRACETLESTADRAAREHFPEWKGVRVETMSRLADEFERPSSPEVARAYLDSLEGRLSGDIEPLVFPYLLAAVSPDDPSWEIRAGWKQAYRTDGHAKSLGVRLHLDVPRSWRADEGKRPHIVQKWGVQNGQGLSTFMVMINDLEGEPLSGDAAEVCAAFLAEVPTAKLTGSRSVKIEAVPAYRCGFSTRVERLDLSQTSANEALMFAWQGKLVSLLAVVPFEGDPARAEAEAFAKAMLNSVGNTAVLPDRYK